MPKEYNDRADDIIEHLDKASAELTKAISKLNSRKIWLKLSSMYKLASVLGKLQHVKEEMENQEVRRNWWSKKK
jgi:hypothetical protein